jgi:hypothetical protein
MANIMIRCPIFGMAVPTGITTEMIILDTLNFPLSMHCPAIVGVDQTPGSLKKIIK